MKIQAQPMIAVKDVQSSARWCTAATLANKN